MNPIILSAVVAMALLPQVHGSDGAQEASGIDVVTGKSDAHRRMTVPVTLGEQGTYHFLIDTGAQNTVVSSELAARLAMTPGDDVTLVGVAGSQRVGTVEIDEITLGRRSFTTLVAPVLERDHVGADGILGLDSLQDQRVLIDFTRNMMAVGDAKALGGNNGFEIVVRARQRSGQLIITNARIDGVWTDVVVDTGAETTIGNRALQRALKQRGNEKPAVLASVTGQQIPADVGFAQALDLGKISVNNVLLAFADSPSFAQLGLEKRPAILLGMRELRSFKRVAIDFDKRQVLFDVPFSVNDPVYLRAMSQGSAGGTSPSKVLY